MAKIIRFLELKYAIRLANNELSNNKIKQILMSCSVPDDEANYLAVLGNKIYNKRLKYFVK